MCDGFVKKMKIGYSTLARAIRCNVLGEGCLETRFKYVGQGSAGACVRPKSRIKWDAGARVYPCEESLPTLFLSTLSVVG